MNFRGEDIVYRAENMVIMFLQQMKPILTLKIKFFKILAKSKFINLIFLKNIYTWFFKIWIIIDCYELDNC